MQPHSETPEELSSLRDRIIGLGETSVHKSYYPELQERMEELERFRALLDEATDLIMVIRIANFQCVDMNHAFSSLLGYACTRRDPKDFFAIFPDEARDRMQAFMKTAAESPQQEKIETVIRTISGEFIEIELSLRLVTFHSERFGVIVARDIRERKKNESALLTAQKKLSLIYFLTRNDIKSKTFVVRAYLDVLRQIAKHPEETVVIEKLTHTTEQIQRDIEYAETYQDMGAQEPTWQHFNDVLLYAVSHLPPITISRKTVLTGIEIHADLLLEKGLMHLMEFIYMQGKASGEVTISHTESARGLHLIFEKQGAEILPGKKETLFLWNPEKNSAQNLFFIREILEITSIAIHETGNAGTLRFEILVPKEAYRFS